MTQMKRWLVIAWLLCLGAVAHAQWGVSANLGFSMSNYSHTVSGQTAYDKTLPQGLTLDFAPRIGYAFSERWSAGVDLGFGYRNYNYTDGYYNPDKEEWEQSELLNQALYSGAVGLFVRVRVLSWDRLSLHAELAAGYRQGFGTQTSTQYREDGWGDLQKIVTSRAMNEGQLKLQVVPVFHYRLGNQESERLSLDVYLNVASVAFVRTITNVYGEKSLMSNGTELYSHTVTNDVDLAVRTLDASPVTIGFSYLF